MKEKTQSGVKDKVMGAMEKFSKAMVQPLSYLSAAGILIVIGVLITNNTIKGVLPFLQWGPIQALGQLIYNAVMGIINNLSVLFIIGIPAALANWARRQMDSSTSPGDTIIRSASSSTIITICGIFAGASPPFMDSTALLYPFRSLTLKSANFLYRSVISATPQ